MIKLSLLIVFLTLPLFSDSPQNETFMLLSEKEVSAILLQREQINNNIITDIIVDDKTYPGLSMKIYKYNDTVVAKMISDKNLKSMSEKSKALGTLECMSKNNLLTEEVVVDFKRY